MQTDERRIARLCEKSSLPAPESVVPLKSGHSGGRLHLVEAGGRRLVAKVGPRDKVEAEAEGALRWADQFPGTTRRPLVCIAFGLEAGVLGDYLPGRSVAELIAEGGASGDRALAELSRVMLSVWRKTAAVGRAPSRYSGDIASRLHVLLEARPALAAVLDAPAAGLRGREVLFRLQALEERLLPPFSVLVHGDLTPDNVLFDPATSRISFLDLARAGPGDYLLDVGKFLAADLRERGSEMAEGSTACAPLVEAARTFSLGRGDRLFDRRLQVSCARTLLGSARLMETSQAEWQIRAGLQRIACALEGLV